MGAAVLDGRATAYGAASSSPVRCADDALSPGASEALHDRTAALPVQPTGQTADAADRRLPLSVTAPLAIAVSLGLWLAILSTVQFVATRLLHG